MYEGAYTPTLALPRRGGRGTAGSGYPECEGLGRFRVQMTRHLMAGGNLL
jgi:hypothetical protein